MRKPLFRHFSKILFIALSCIIFANQTFSQSRSEAPGSMTELIIGQGETYLVTQSQSVLKLQKLSIGDNATIRFSEDLDHWFVEALETQIGDNVTIDGVGSSGVNGEDGAEWTTEALNCGVGRPGAKGGSGTHGENGIRIQMRLGLTKFGALAIDTSGGHGGKGGHGASGQNAGQEANCDQADGGDGGQGGNGGNGGDAGSVRVSLWDASTSTKIAHESLANITVTANAGEAGQAGEGGAQGQGSEGRYVNRRSLSGNKRWSPGGKNGVQGIQGKPGEDANAGRVEIEELFLGSTSLAPAPTMAQENPEQERPSKQGSSTNSDTESAEIAAMKKQIEALQKRLDEMEKAN